MALNFPSSPSTNDTYTDDNSAVWQFDGEKWNVITRTTKRAFVGARVRLSSDFSLGSTLSGVSFATEDFDTGSFWASGQPTRLSITENGFYRINAQLQAGTSGTSQSYTFAIYKNGSSLISSQAAANQYIVYDEIIQLAVGDYVEIFASESTSVGTLESDNSFFEITQVGLNLGTGVSTWSAFSGAKAVLTAAESCTSTATAIPWDDMEYDQNADVLGSTYYAAGTPSRLTTKVTGYYQVKVLAATNSQGGENTYTVTVRKNGSTTLETTTIGPSDTLYLDKIYAFTANDYIEVLISNSGSVGQIQDTAYLEIVRLGV